MAGALVATLGVLVGCGGGSGAVPGVEVPSTRTTATPSAEPSRLSSDTRTEVLTAASQALVAALGYDTATLDSDEAAARLLMTSRYGRVYSKSFDLVRTNVGTARVVVTAKVGEVGIVGISDDEAVVLAFVDQSTARSGSASSVLQNRVQATLVRSGEDWLLDGVSTAPGPALSEPDADRRAAMNVGEELYSAIGTHSSDDLDGFEHGVLALLTGEARSAFVRSMTSSRALLAKPGSDSTARVASVAVATLSGRRARVLVTGDVTVGKRLTTQRIVLDLERVDGDWLVSDITVR